MCMGIAGGGCHILRNTLTFVAQLPLMEARIARVCEWGYDELLVSTSKSRNPSEN
jgi:hypothetical protein